MKRRITPAECEKMYIDNNTPNHVIGHCKEVSRVAGLIGEELVKKGFDLDVDLIIGAGLAHDVCRVHEDHGRVCAKLLRKMGFEDEAGIVSEHMYHEFNPFPKLEEIDIVCLGDRVVEEDKYVGLDERIEYLIHKAGDVPEITKRLLEKKQLTLNLILKVEEVIEKKLDEFCMKG